MKTILKFSALLALIVIVAACADQKKVTQAQATDTAATTTATSAASDKAALDAKLAQLQQQLAVAVDPLTVQQLQRQLADTQAQLTASIQALNVAQTAKAKADADLKAAADTYNANTQHHLDEINTGSGLAALIPGYGTIGVAILGTLASLYTRYRGIAQGTLAAGEAVATGQGNLPQTPAGDPAVTFHNNALIDLLHKAGASPALINSLTV